MSGIPFENTRRGAEYYDHHIPKIAKSLERIANALEKGKQADQVRSMTDEFVDREMQDLMRCTIRSAEPTRNGWISVKDRMPEAGVHVLVACKVRIIGGGAKLYVCDAFHTSKFSFIAVSAEYDDIDCDYNEETDEYYYPEGWWEVIKNWDDYGCVAIQDEVIYWMPLPEPPKGVQDDE